MNKTTVSNTAASASKGQSTKPGCTDCETLPDVHAVILYPSLGTPLVLAPGQTHCSIIIATSDTMGAISMDTKEMLARSLKDLDESIASTGVVPAKARPAKLKEDEATTLYRAVDRHLRLTKMSEKKLTDDTTQGTLFADAKSYAAAKAAITGRYLGHITQQLPFTTKDASGAVDMAFTLSPHAVKLYQAHGHVFEVVLDLSAAPFKAISDGEFMSFAWMVKQAKPSADLPGTHAHCNDLAIAKFRNEQSKVDHFGTWKEFDLSAPLRQGMPAAKVAKENGIWSWHPVIRSKAQGQLKLGHLSDVHVNIRQNVLAESTACILEGASDAKPVGDKVSNCMEALKNLFEQFGSGDTKADALVITGDLIDFNRNLCPTKAQGTIEKQWSAFNVINNVMDHSVYPRGQDDMLMFSLVRYAYTNLQLPVFMTTGNHEAYQVPYGISPRVEVVRDVAGRGLTESVGLTFSDVVRKMSAKEKESLNAYAENKANPGISADHNMTLFEATLAYGPTYAQVILTENFHNSQFDWFYALFTPLTNWCVHYGASPEKPRQALVGLGWGDAENYKNAGNLNPLDSDNQGLGILPRSVDGISEAQKQILIHAQNRKAQGKAKTISVFSHFTLINYGGDVALNAKGASLPVADGAFESYNTGTCQKNQKWYFTECINAQGKAVDYHFSGHSHRAGVYLGDIRRSGRNSTGEPRFDISSAFEPVTTPFGLGPVGQTALLVSSSGGPVGVQNYAGELQVGGDSWTLRPPSGTLLDPNRHTVQRVAVNTVKVPTAKPRLCVALDYVHLSKPDSLQFTQQLLRAEKLPDLWKLELTLAKNFLDIHCIEGVKFWVYQKGDEGTKGKRSSAGWVQIDPSYTTTAQGAVIEFTKEHTALLNTLWVEAPHAKVVSPMFAQIKLREPSNPKLSTKLWASDMNCTDPWIFPVQLKVTFTPNQGSGPAYMYKLERPSGEHGEIPDWKWLHKTYGKYPDIGEIIGATQATPKTRP